LSRFLRSLRKKIRVKSRRFPGELDLAGLPAIANFQQFDDRYTAPLHGFKNAADYWTRSSCRQFLPSIEIPTLLVNALNDPFLGPNCYPREEAERSPRRFTLEIPGEGGHVGFPLTGGRSWAEERALEFLSNSDIPV
jgi:predicted alpha/beta-fold hydrolase